MPRASGWLWSSLCSLHQRRREWWWGEVSETMAGWHPLYQPCISVTIWDHFSGMNIYCAVLARMKQVWKKVTCQEIICPIKWNTVYSIIIPCPTHKDKREISFSFIPLACYKLIHWAILVKQGAHTFPCFLVSADVYVSHLICLASSPCDVGDTYLHLIDEESKV